MSLQEKISKCIIENDLCLANAIVCDFNEANSVLIKKSEATPDDNPGEIEKIKTALDTLRKQYKTSDALVQSAIEPGIKKLEKRYTALAGPREVLDQPLELTLLWNSNNGDRELLMPVKWNQRQNIDAPTEHSLMERLYAQALTVLLEYDINITEQEWNDYTTLVSKNVAGRVSEDISANYDIIQLAAASLEEQISEALQPALEQVNISLKVIESKLRTNKYQNTESEIPQPKKEQTPAEPKQSKKDIAGIVDKYVCVNTSDAADYLGLSTSAVIQKINHNYIHSVRRSKRAHSFIPAHDLITYTYNYPQLERTSPKSPVYAHKLQALTDEQFEKYKSEIGELYTVKEVADVLQIGRSTTCAYLNDGKIHGIKYKGAWYVPKLEVDFVKDLESLAASQTQT
jgi:hypothetical protein